MTLLSVDIETSCAVVACPGFGGHKKCDHALHHLRNKIDCIGVVYEDSEGAEHGHVFRSISAFGNFLSTMPGYGLLFHNFKFDVKNLRSRGFQFHPATVYEDTYLMLVAYTYKIDPNWLEDYEAERKVRNKAAGGAVHREAGQYSLKAAAPYFAGVAPFWEVADMDNNDYVLADCRNTLKLYKALRERMAEDGTLDFYREKLVPWAHHLTDVELRGVHIDVEMMRAMRAQTEQELEEIKKKLHKLWKPAYCIYNRQQRQKLYKEYAEKYKDQPKRWARATKSLINKIKKIPPTLNLASPTQVYWLFKEYMGCDIRNDEGKETTGHAVLEKLIKAGYLDLQLFMDMKEKEKLITSFFDSYEEKLVDGKLYTSYNMGGTRTGRLSCNSPNLQQVSGDLHKLFIAAPGNLLITQDESAIEPRLIAYYSADPRLCRIMQDPQDDFHCNATAAVFEHVSGSVAEIKKKFKKERDCAKQLDLSWFYGSGANRTKTTFVTHGFHVSEADVKYKLRAFKSKFPGVFEFKRDLDNVLERGEQIETVTGRRFRFEDPMDVYMKGFNSMIQSSGSDIVLDSSMRIDIEFRKRGIAGGVLLLVHDELVIEAPEARLEEARQVVIEEMTKLQLENIHGQIPLVVEGKVSQRWEK